MAQSFVNVTSSATVLAPAGNPSAANYVVTISFPPTGTGGVCYVGQSGVTTSTGTEFRPGSIMTVFNLAGGIFAITASGTVTLSVAVNVS